MHYDTILLTLQASDHLDTQRSFYVESGRYTTKYLRIVRICFTRPFFLPPLQQCPLCCHGCCHECCDSSIDSDSLSSSSSVSSSSSLLRLNRDKCRYCPPDNQLNFECHHCNQKLQNKAKKFLKAPSIEDSLRNNPLHPRHLTSLPRLATLHDPTQPSLDSADYARWKRKMFQHSRSLNQQNNPLYSSQYHTFKPSQRHKTPRPSSLQPPISANYATFEPLMLSAGGVIGIPLFERLSETMRRAMMWLEKCDPSWSLVSVP